MALEKFWTTDRFAIDVARRAAIANGRLAEMAELIPDARVKGRGMMQGLDVGSGDLAADICPVCFRNGLIIETSGAFDEVVKVLAPLTTPDDVLEEGLAILARAVDVAVSSLSRAA